MGQGHPRVARAADFFKNTTAQTQGEGTLRVNFASIILLIICRKLGKLTITRSVFRPTVSPLHQRTVRVRFLKHVPSERR